MTVRIRQLAELPDLIKARKLHYRTTFQGLKISIENRKGSWRHWTTEQGLKGKTKMLLPYGYVLGTVGADDDHLDVFLGPNKHSRRVFVVNQRAAHKDGRKFDEHKCMLGFDSPEDAKDAYLKHFDRPEFFGSMTEMTIERFKRWIFNGKKKHRPVHKSQSVSLDVAVADSLDELQQGLKGARKGKGLVLAFPRTGQHVLTMNSVKHPLDLVWMDANRKIIDVQAARPGTDTITSPDAVRFVLEAPKGFAKQQGLKVGDTLRWPDSMQKAARGGKYIKRVPYWKNGKKHYRYYYAESAAARDVKAGENIRLGKKVLEVLSVTSDAVTLRDKDGKTIRVPQDEWGKYVARYYGKQYHAWAEKRATQTINAVLRHVPKSMLQDLKGETDAERLDELKKRVPEVYARLKAAFDRAGISPERARRIVGETLNRRGWQAEARALVVGKVIEHRELGHRELIQAAENLAGGARKVAARHVAAVVELRAPGGSPGALAAKVAVTEDKAAKEMSELSAAMARGATPEERAQALATALAAQAMQQLVELQKAYPSLDSEVAEQARQALMEAVSRSPGPPKQVGAETSVFVAGEGGQPVSMRATYRLVEAGDAIASHDPTKGFKKRSEYPEDVQERAYHRDQAEQLKVIGNAQRMNPEFVVNTNPDAVNGPPIMTPEGIVLGGNSRTMSLQLAYEDHPEKAAKYREYLEAQAHQMGFRADDVRAMKRPILVRVVEPDTPPAAGLFGEAPKERSKEELQLLVRQFNESFTQGMDPRTMQVAMGRKLSEGTLKILADGMEADESLGAFLASSRSESFINALFREGIIDQRNANQYMVKGTRKLNQDGRTLVARILVGRTVKDADVLSETGTQMVDSIARATPAMVQAKAYGEGYDLSEDLRVAIDGFNHLQRQVDNGTLPPLDPKMPESRFKNLFAQQTLLGVAEQHPVADNPRAMLLFEALVRKRGPVQLTNIFREYTRLASQNPEGQSTMFGEALTPIEVLRQAVRGEREEKLAASLSERLNVLEALRG